MRFVTALLVVGLLVPGLTLAGTTGKVAGVVKDRKTGEPVPGANVALVGAGGSVVTGAVTDLKGNYAILNVLPGTYSVKCTFIGYREIVIRNITALVDFTTAVDFAIESEAIQLGQAVEVVATRPLVQRDQTGSVRFAGIEDIKNMPLRGYEAVTALQAGVTDFGGAGLYVRGGRQEEVAYFVDGFSQQDPLTGVSRTSINNNAIDQVNIFVGGFNAEYGRAMSGVVNVVTKEGGKNYSGTFEAVTDEPTSRGWLKTPSYGYNNFDGALSGPLVPNNDRITFYLSAERRDREDRSPKANVGAYGIDSLAVYGKENTMREEDYKKLKDGVLPHNDLEGWTWQGKLNFKVSNNVNLKIGVLGSKNIWNTYRQEYRYNLRHSPRVRDYNSSAFARLTYSISSKTFLTLAGNYFMTRREAGDGRYFDNLKAYGRPKGNPFYFGNDALFWQGDNLARPDSLAFDLNSRFEWNAGDEGRVWGRYTKTRSSYITPIKFDITSQVTPHHEVQAGFDVQRHTLRSFDHLIAYLIYRGAYVDANNRGGFADLDAFGYKFDWNANKVVPVDDGPDRAKHPVLASFYVQDKIEYQGLVVNAGLRYDYLGAKTKTLKNPKVPLGGDSKLDDADLAGTQTYQKVSPRLGVGFPITDRTLFHANYGKFHQQPNLENLYVSNAYLEYKAPLLGYFYAFGNPNLKPEETTAYEVGFTRQLGGSASLDVTAYYKDTKNLVQVEAVPSTPAQFSTYVNKDFGTVKGIDVTVVLRRTRRTQANVGYSLMYATGTGSNPDTQRNIAWQFQPGFTEPPRIIAPLNFDQRHKISINVDYRLGQKDGPALWGTHPLSNAGINLLFKAGSGFPYTPTFPYNEVTLAATSSRPSGPINSSYGPWAVQVDLKANKDFVAGQHRVSLYVVAINLLNRKNVAAWAINDRGFESSVYTGTGLPDETRWLSTEDGRKFVEQFGETGRQKYLIKQNDPRNYSTPRQVRFGMAYSF